jgi:predicted NACHT family NTPase
MQERSEFCQALQSLKNRLHDPESANQNRKAWWKSEGKEWIKDFREVLNRYGNIGHDWQFSDEQKGLLQQYYDANLLLVDCLNSDCYVSKEVRQEIEDTLLLPIPKS